mmetsp:Transcript_15659/g.51254  ORF Transcript_15659/g.51254 Transcript_15659/m.51254 type:complete len:275 (+) Transcript_15659:16-840(+)
MTQSLEGEFTLKRNHAAATGGSSKGQRQQSCSGTKGGKQRAIPPIVRHELLGGARGFLASAQGDERAGAVAVVAVVAGRAEGAGLGAGEKDGVLYQRAHRRARCGGHCGPLLDRGGFSDEGCRQRLRGRAGLVGRIGLDRVPRRRRPVRRLRRDGIRRRRQLRQGRRGVAEVALSHRRLGRRSRDRCARGRRARGEIGSPRERHRLFRGETEQVFTGRGRTPRRRTGGLPKGRHDLGRGLGLLGGGKKNFFFGRRRSKKKFCFSLWSDGGGQAP